MIRKIIHIDMDAFYASIEQRDNPELKGRPVIVGGRPEDRGVVAAASYEARQFGIHSAMPTSRAVSLCRNLIILYPDFKKYKIISEHLYRIYEEYTDLIEPVSLDEAYLDVTENKKNIPTATEISIAIKKRIKNELKLTASAGVAPNKLLAKIASDERKPDGLFIIKPHQIKDYVKSLEVKKIWGVGKATQKKMYDMGVLTCGDLQRYPKEDLIRIFGKFGGMLYSFCRGIDNRPVVTDREIKSIGSETTFPEDYLDIELIKEALLKQAEIVSGRLIRSNIKGRTITIKIKYADFIQITRSLTLDNPANDLKDLFTVAEKLLLEKTEAGRRRVRLVGISVGNFGEAKKSADELLFDI
jgi:DNA polymerase-4